MTRPPLPKFVAVVVRDREPVLGAPDRWRAIIRTDGSMAPLEEAVHESQHAARNWAYDRLRARGVAIADVNIRIVDGVKR